MGPWCEDVSTGSGSDRVTRIARNLWSEKKGGSADPPIESTQLPGRDPTLPVLTFP